MNVLKQTINRAKQTVEEKFGDAEKTAFDPAFQATLDRMEDIRVGTEKILSSLEVYLQPDPAIRILPGLSQEGMNKIESLGADMTTLGNKLGSTHNFGAAMMRSGDAFAKVGKAEKEFLARTNQSLVLALKRFIGEELKNYEQERKTLHNKRLDMDAIKTKVTKGGATAAHQEELQKAEKAYHETVGRVKLMADKVEEALPQLQTYLKELVKAQLDHLQASEEALKELYQKI